MWLHRILTAALLALIGGFYLWTVGQGLALPFGKTHADLYYNGLTDGFLAGHLYLPTEPSPELLAAADPYDPHQNAGLKLHDASFYKGKYYLYFGVTPVVLLFLPFRVLGMGDLPQNVAVAVLAFGGVLWSFLTLSFLRRTCVPGRGHGALYATLLALGFGGAIPFLLRRPDMYEVAISCGFFCLAAALYFLTSAALQKKGAHWRAGLGSLFLGLAVGARPNLVFAAPVLWLVWMYRREGGLERLRRLATALVLPFFAVLFLLLLYNYLRFDSWTQFGNGYQLPDADVRELMMDTRRVPFFAYFYLWAPCDVNWVFPYVHVSREALSLAVPGFSAVEPVAGVFFTTPFLCVLALLPILWRSAAIRREEGRASEHERTLGLVAWILAGLGVCQVLFLSLLPGATMRYIPDFSYLLITAAGVAVLGLELQWRSIRWRARLMRMCIAPLVALSIFFNLGIGLTGYYDNLKGNNPAAYEAIRSATDPIATSLASRFIRGDVSVVWVAAPDRVRTSGGVEYFWVGKDEVLLTVLSKREGSASLRLHVTKEDNRPDLGARSLIVSAGSLRDEKTVVEDGDVDLTVPVYRGFNEVHLSVTDVPQAVLPRTGPEFAALRVEGWRVSLAPDESAR